MVRVEGVEVDRSALPPARMIPFWALARAAVPLALVPMRLPWIRSPDAPAPT